MYPMNKSRAAAIASALCAALLLLPAGCKKTVEGESKSWTRNTRRIAELKALYPGFAAPLGERLKQAEAAMAAAKKVSDEGEKAKQMATANATLMRGFVRELDGIDDKIRRVRSKITSAATSARDKSDRAAVRQASADARRVIGEVNARLKKGAASAVAADTILRKVDRDLDEAKRNLDRVISSAKGKQQAAQDKAKAKAEATAREEAAKKEATKPWKCPYCDAMNAHTAMKCKNCNAPRGK